MHNIVQIFTSYMSSQGDFSVTALKMLDSVREAAYAVNATIYNVDEPKNMIMSGFHTLINLVFSSIENRSDLLHTYKHANLISVFSRHLLVPGTVQIGHHQPHKGPVQQTSTECTIIM